MPNANNPAPSDCDHRGYTGCTSCGCSECGALVDRDTLGPLEIAPGVVVQACAACRAFGDSDAPKPDSLKPAAVALLASLPRQIRTCQAEYSVALALAREGLVRLDERTVLGNGQVRYLVTTAADSDGVPEAVGEEVTEKTVRAAYVPIGPAGLGDVRASRKAAAL